MSYRYLGTSIKKADKAVPCDVLRGFFDYGPRELIVKADIVLIIRYKGKQIEKGTEYTEHLIVDEDTGEELALNCFTELSKVGIRNNLFPKEILNQIINESNR